MLEILEKYNIYPLEKEKIKEILEYINDKRLNSFYFSNILHEMNKNKDVDFIGILYDNILKIVKNEILFIINSMKNDILDIFNDFYTLENFIYDLNTITVYYNFCNTSFDNVEQDFIKFFNKLLLRFDFNSNILLFFKKEINKK